MVQPIKTERYGELRFVKIYASMPTNNRVTGERQTMGGSIGKLENGSWCHFASGHPIDDYEDALRILKEANPRAVPEFEHWWERKLELEAMGDEEQPRAITLTHDGKLVYADKLSEEVRRAEDIHAYFQPGPHRDMIFTIFMRAQQERDQRARMETLGHRTAQQESELAFEQALRQHVSTEKE